MGGWVQPDMTDAEKIELLGHMVDFLFLQLVEHHCFGNADMLRASLAPEGRALLDSYVEARHG